jgi:hypothetical protein
MDYGPITNEVERLTHDAPPLCHTYFKIGAAQSWL